MTLLEAIQKANESRPNDISDERKSAWVYELEAQFAEMMEVPIPENAFDEDPDARLLMPAPYDRCYELYLMAMIDHDVQDMDMFNDDISVSNDAIKSACAWWRRTHRPKSAGNWRTM